MIACARQAFALRTLLLLGLWMLAPGVFASPGMEGTHQAQALRSLDDCSHVAMPEMPGCERPVLCATSRDVLALASGSEVPSFRALGGSHPSAEAYASFPVMSLQGPARVHGPPLAILLCRFRN